MDVSSTTGTSSSSAAPTSMTGLADQYDQFLTLLTTQLQNQDPLNPMDNKDMVNQLVNFASVEQQIKQNDNLESLIGLLNSSADAAALSYIGKDVQVEGDITHYDGENPVTFGYTPPKDTQELAVKIYDSAGKVIREFEGSTSSQRHTVTWDGTDQNGDPTEPGLYYFAIAAENSEGDTVHGTVDITGRVTGTGTSDSGPTLMIGDAEYSLGEVMAVRGAGNA
ncbi:MULTISPECIES: flagellar hook assembly protein FlgD [Thalassobaculum]|uniref:Basal-body rod modification protein FlgD n=1 Tax=Thalassobaculum litoreum DSM 18839 TaxID=1123362 RepID=A0A8G2EZJ1_9PROT|nr:MULTISPECIES: flagellar hook assembly protein FlgD [Thalassobaculum]SDG27700.1 flagellar basal-body rod modification protein FlgD [Thalassobaculum litoreum DSM 18839]